MINLPLAAAEQITSSGESAELSFSSFFGSIRSAIIEMSGDFATLIPKLLVGLVLLFLGFVFAKIIAKVISTLFDRLGINTLLEKIGFTKTLGNAGITAPPGEIIAKIAFILSMLFAVKMAAREASIQDISDIVNSIIAFTPNVITAGIILVVGFFIADTAKSAISTSLAAAGLEYARTLSKFVFGFIIIVVLTVALAQINIETELVNTTVKIALAAIGLALALSLGLGLKGMAKNVVSGVYSRDLYKTGTEVEYEGETMTIAGVGPVTTKLTRNDGGFVIVPNDQLISQPVRGRSAN